MPVFVLQFLPIFRGAEVPGFRPEIPAPGSSGPFFHLSFLAKSFRRFSREGFRNFAPEVSSEISGGPEIPVLGPKYPAQGKFG